MSTDAPAVSSGPTPFGADRIVSAIVHSGESSPDSGAPAQESPDPGQPPQPQPDQTPDGRSPDGSEKPAVSLDALDPEAQEFVRDLYQGDLSKALAGALHNHRRISELSHQAQTPQAAPEPIYEAAPPPQEAPVPQEQLARAVSDLLDKDQETRELVAQYNATTTRSQEIANRLNGPDGLKRQIEVETIRYSLPEISEDPLRAAETKDRLRELQVEHRLLELEARELKFRDKDLHEQFEARKNYFENQASEPLRAAAKQAEFTAAVDRHYSELKQSWPAAIQQAVSSEKIPQDLVADFQEEARTAALAHDGAIGDPVAFVTQRAKRYMESRMKFHSSLAAEYGRQAVARAQQTGSGQGVAQTENPTQASGVVDIRQVIADRGKVLRQSFMR